MDPAQKTSRVDEAYARLKLEILENRLAPGLQAMEPEFALQLGMSRTPVREALIRLETEGLVELIPRRGARILPIEPDDMREIYAILVALEPEAAAAIAAAKPPREDLKGLEDATRRMERALEADDLDAWAQADDAYHCEILRLCGNRRMRKFIRTLFDQTHRARATTLRLRERPVKSTREHRLILKHIRAGDVEATRKVFREHRSRAAEELLQLLKKIRLSRL